MVNSVVFWTLSSCCCSTIGIELYSQQVCVIERDGVGYIGEGKGLAN